jgi:hypothetical protein
VRGAEFLCKRRAVLSAARGRGENEPGLEDPGSAPHSCIDSYSSQVAADGAIKLFAEYRPQTNAANRLGKIGKSHSDFVDYSDYILILALTFVSSIYLGSVVHYAFPVPLVAGGTFAVAFVSGMGMLACVARRWELRVELAREQKNLTPSVKERVVSPKERKVRLVDLTSPPSARLPADEAPSATPPSSPLPERTT